MLVLEWKERVFMEKVNSRCFRWFLAAILVHQNGTPIWCLHTKLYKGAWNASANNSETVGHKDLRPEKIVYKVVFYNISFSCLLPLDGFQFIFSLRDSKNYLQADSIRKSGSRNSGLFACGIGNEESERFFLWSSKSRSLESGVHSKESGSPYKNGIRTPCSTDKETRIR